MIIHENSRHVILHLRNPDRVTTVIPSARKMQLRGETIVAVPHRLDEARVLRNLGINVPSPALHYYNWPGRFPPFMAQRATTDFLTLHPKAFCLNDMGTGKTLSVLWSYDYLRSIGKARKMLVVAPLSTLERTWADEVFKHFPHLSSAVVYGPKARRLKMLALDVDIYIINHDGLGVVTDALLARDDIDIVAIDEIAAFRNASTALWKTLRKICTGRERLWGLTGTPTPNLPTDAWAQCRLISPERVPTYFGKFRDTVMRQLGPFKWLPRDGATEIVAEAMQPAIRFALDDCTDLPEMTYQTRSVAMTAEQTKAYKEMLAKLRMEFKDQQVTAVNAAVKTGKLVQIACGVVYGKGGEEVLLPCQPRIDEVIETIRQAGAKCIVFVPYTAVLMYVAEELAKQFTVAVINGATSKAKRDTIFAEFQGCTDPRVLVAQEATMSHGLTLTAADTIIWYAPTTSNDGYQQANARVRRPGQKRTTRVVNIEASPVERAMYQRLQDKQSMQGLLLDLVS